MEMMKGDMGGGAAVAMAFMAAAQLQVDEHVVCLVPACFNMPGGAATNPGDVVRAMNGQTVEIINTDAEGRLLLADALHYAHTFDPAAVVDVATLTGAIDVALGGHYFGVYSREELLWSALQRAGKESGEFPWRMPLDVRYRKKMDSDVADIKNAADRSGGSISAAMFLSDFVKVERWAHLDIAGVMYSPSDLPYQPKGMTGAATRTLIEFILNSTAK